jgi:transposase-like protein
VSERLPAARTEVHRVGDTIVRGGGPWSSSVHALLQHLASAGFRGAPRVVGNGFDDEGREMLSYLEGEFVHPRAWSEAGIAELGHLLRELHEASSGFRPPPSAIWQPWFTRSRHPTPSTDMATSVLGTSSPAEVSRSASLNRTGFRGGSISMTEDGVMAKAKGSAPYPRELREQAVRLVREWRREHDRTDGGLHEVSQQLGVHVETIRNWLRQAEVDSGDRPGASSEEKARIKELERENAELRRANEILKSAATFFGAELDRQRRR